MNTAEDTFARIKESGKKYIIITGNENWKTIIRDYNGYFFCIRNCYSYANIKKLIEAMFNFDLGILILCDRCCNNPRMRLEIMSRLRKGLEKYGTDIVITEA